VNLHRLETIFTERRPFFSEGDMCWSAVTSNYYYSRRICRAADRSRYGDLRRLSEHHYILGRRPLTGRFQLSNDRSDSWCRHRMAVIGAGVKTGLFPDVDVALDSGASDRVNSGVRQAQVQRSGICPSFLAIGCLGGDHPLAACSSEGRDHDPARHPFEIWQPQLQSNRQKSV